MRGKNLVMHIWPEEIKIKRECLIDHVNELRVSVSISMLLCIKPA